MDLNTLILFLWGSFLMALPNPHPHHWSPEDIMMVWIEETGVIEGSTLQRWRRTVCPMNETVPSSSSSSLQIASFVCSQSWRFAIRVLFERSVIFLCELFSIELSSGNVRCLCNVSFTGSWFAQLARFPCRPGDKVSETLSGLLSWGQAAIQWAKWYNEPRSCGCGCALCSAVSIQMLHADNYTINVNKTVTWDKEERGCLAAL